MEAQTTQNSTAADITAKLDELKTKVDRLGRQYDFAMKALDTLKEVAQDEGATGTLQAIENICSELISMQEPCDD